MKKIFIIISLAIVATNINAQLVVDHTVSSMTCGILRHNGQYLTQVGAQVSINNGKIK